jgi:hypothetical protein
MDLSYRNIKCKQNRPGPGYGFGNEKKKFYLSFFLDKEVNYY